MATVATVPPTIAPMGTFEDVEANAVGDEVEVDDEGEVDEMEVDEMEVDDELEVDDEMEVDDMEEAIESVYLRYILDEKNL